MDTDQGEYGFDIYGDEDFGEFGIKGMNANENIGFDTNEDMGYDMNITSKGKVTQDSQVPFYLILFILFINLILISTFILKKKEKSLKVHYVLLLTKIYCQLFYSIIITAIAYILCKNSNLCNLTWIFLLVPLYSLSSICLSLLGFLA